MTKFHKKFVFLLFSFGVVVFGVFGMWYFSSPPIILGGEETSLVKEISFNAPLRFEFSAPMETESVEAAFSISPHVPGKFEWEEDKVLLYFPETAFEIGQKFDVTIRSQAKNKWQKKLGSTYLYTFVIVGPPQVTFISHISAEEWQQIQSLQQDQVPESRAEENKQSGDGEFLDRFFGSQEPVRAEQTLESYPLLQTGQRLTLMFDRPIRTLESPEEEIGETLSTFTNFVTFEPEFPGEFRYLGTSAVEFVPDEHNFPLGEIFTVTLRKGAPTSDQGTTLYDISWHFETAAPKVLSMTPSWGTPFVAPKTKVLLNWNQPIDENSFFEHLTITPDLPSGEARKLNVSWDREKDPNAMLLSFEPYFPKDTEVVITVAPGVKSLQGTKVSTEKFVSSFRTIGDPGFLSYFPKNSGEISPHDSLYIELATPTDPEELRKNLQFIPEIDPEKLSIWEMYDPQEYYTKAISSEENRKNSLGRVYQIWAPFAAQTQYQWELSSGFPDRRQEFLEQSGQAGLLDHISEEEQTAMKEESLLPQGFTSTFRTGDYAPYLTQMIKSSGAKGVYDVDERTSLFLQHRNITEVQVQVCQLPQNIFLEQELKYTYTLEEICRNGRNLKTWTEVLPEERNTMMITEIPLSERVDLDAGVYVYDVYAQEYKNTWDKTPQHFRGTLFLTNATLTAKWSDQEVLIWATDFLQGQPIEGLHIHLFESGYDRPVIEIESGITNSDGILSLPLPENEQYSRQYLLFGEEQGKYFTLVGQYWNEGITPWEFDISEDWEQHPVFRSYIYTDRPIYRPGHRVNFKGIVREDVDAVLSIPQDTAAVNVRITSPQGKEIFDEVLDFTADGTFSGEFLLTPDAELGTYFLDASLDENRWFTRTFVVEEYVAPEFRADISTEFPDQTIFLHEDLTINVQGMYYFGGALKNANVAYTIIREPYFFHEWEGSGWYSFADHEQFCWWECHAEETLVASGEGKLNENGKFELTVDTNFSGEAAGHTSFSEAGVSQGEEGDTGASPQGTMQGQTMPQLLTIHATIRTAAEQSVTYTQTFPVLSADGFVGIRPNQYFVSQSDKETSFSLVTVDTEGKIRPAEDVQVDLFQVHWNSIQKEGVDGALYWENSEELMFLDTQKGRTDMQGKTEILFDLPTDDERYSGQLKAVAQWQDEESHTATASTIIYRSSESYVSWQRHNHDRIGLSLDQRSYQVGDTAQLLVASPFAKPVPALLTLERKGILEYRLLEVSPGKALEIPVTQEMMPNVFVSVVLMKGKGIQAIAQGLVHDFQELQIQQQELEKLIPDLQQQLLAAQDMLNALGEEVKFFEKRKAELSVTVLQKRIAEAEEKMAALQVEKNALNTEIEDLKQEFAEDAIFHEFMKEFIEIDNGVVETNVELLLPELPATPIRPEMKMGMIPLYVQVADKQLEVHISPHKESYMPGETVTLTIETLDSTQQGVPADVSLAVVDESVLALKSRNLENIVDFFWGTRSLGVKTASTLVHFVERLNVKAQKGEKGGGGGNLTAEELAQKKRGEFRDTAFWIPNIHTNDQGQAEVQFVLPDNLTSWEIWAVAATKETQVGVAKKTFMSTKELMITPALPRFAIVGDQFQAAFLLHNRSGEKQKIELSLQTENFELYDDPEQVVALENKSQELVQFSGTVQGDAISRYHQFAPLKFTLTATTKNGNLRDELEISVPIHAPAIGENIATSGEVNDLRTEYVRIPRVALEGIGGVSLSLAATRLQSVLEGLENLLRYPYGCAEQTMSRYFPLIAVQRLIDELDTDVAAKNLLPLQEDMDDMVQTGLQRLSLFQRGDGGFGYWENSQWSSPYLTAYVLYGLFMTQKSDYSVDTQVLVNAKNYLWGALNSQESCSDYSRPCMDADTRAFAVFVLSELQEPVEKVQPFLNILMQQKETLSMPAQFFLLLTAQNIGAADHQITIRGGLQSQALHTPRGVQFEMGENSSPWAMNSHIKTTALALLAFTRENSNHPLSPKIAEYLMKSKYQGRSDTAWGSTQDTAWVLIALLEYLQKTEQLQPNFSTDVRINDQQYGSYEFTSKDLFAQEYVEVLIDELSRGNELNEITLQKEGMGVLSYDILTNYYLPAEYVTEQNMGLGIVRNYYRLDDTKKLHPVTSAHKGETLRGELKILVPQTRHFVAVAEYLPAGLTAVNFNLETSDKSLLFSEETQQNSSWYWWDNMLHFHQKEMRDDRVLLFADYLPAGTYEYNYYVTANVEGEFRHLPAVAEEMYTPEVFGRTNGGVFVVKE